MSEAMEDLRYPIGRFDWEGPTDASMRPGWLRELESLPADLRHAVSGLDDARLDVPYRPGGWTSRQVVHHLADSHLNGYIRCKWALTEGRPRIKPYDEAAWAELPDSRAPIGMSLDLLEALVLRWALLLRALPEPAWSREYVHPENGPIRLERYLGLYAWHGRHHLAHVTRLRERMGW